MVTALYIPPVKTLLPLARYAQIIGINPIQFWGGVASTYFPDTRCSDRWRQYDWQDGDKISRDAIAREIRTAETDIAAQLRFWPGLDWTTDEKVIYPKYYRPELTALRGYTAKGDYKSITMRYGKFYSGGTRAITKIGTVAVGGADLIYSDGDDDGYKETATITIATSVTDPYEISLFLAGYNGDEMYELRPVISKSISGGVATIVMHSWNLLRRDLMARFPIGSTDNLNIDAEVDANYLQSVDVYRVYNDPEDQATLYWDGAPQVGCATCGGSGCPECDPVTQIACLSARKSDEGTVVVMPASAYDSGSFTIGYFCTGYEPDRVAVNYRNGVVASPYGNSAYEPPHDLAKAITYIATARLSTPLCTNCENVRAREENLKMDLSMIQRGKIEETQFITKEVMTCPFGTRRGEVEAWRIVKDRIARSDVRVDVLLV